MLCRCYVNSFARPFGIFWMKSRLKPLTGELRGSSRALRKKQFFAIRKIVFFGHCPCAGNELLQLLLVRKKLQNMFSGSEKKSQFLWQEMEYQDRQGAPQNENDPENEPDRTGPTRSILIVSHGPGRSGTLSSPARSLRCNPSSGARQKTLVTPPLGNSKAMARSMLEAQDFGKTTS